jgi:TolB-like protein/Tfp pilus assembly protein PilF
MSRVVNLIREFRRRQVFRATVVYMVSAWVILQVADLALPGLGIPESAIRYVWIGAFLGFPLALVFSWFYDITARGITRTAPMDPGSDFELGLQPKDVSIVVAMVIALGLISSGVVKQIISTDPLTPPGEASLPAREVQPNSIAVLPFANIGNDAANVEFALGVHDDVLAQLAKISAFTVISRTSVMRYRDTSLTVPQIARELGVVSILEGGVRRSGNSVRINVQLIEAQTDRHLWAETYDRDLTARDLFSIQSEIAESISTALNSTLTSDDREALANIPTENMDAYFAYLIGRQRMANRTAESLEQAAELFQKAIDLDPSYALAYVGLADTWMLLGDYGRLSIEEMAARALPALDRALELDDQLAPAYATLGAVRGKLAEFGAAEASHRRAIQLDPNYATAFHWYGDMLVTFLGRHDEAAPLLERASLLDPMSPTITVTLGEAYESLGNFEAAERQYARAMEIAPEYPGAYFLMAGLNRFVNGRLDEAVRWQMEGLARNPDMVSALAILGLQFLDLGDDEQAEFWIGRAMELGPGHFFANRALVFLHRYRNQRDAALRQARRLLEVVPGNNASLLTLVHFGAFDEALQSISGNYPELSCEGAPEVNSSNYFQALNLSLALEGTGDPECAKILLDGVESQMKLMPRRGFRGFGFGDVEVYARQGRTQDALQALGTARDFRLRGYWWSQTERSQHTVSLRDEPLFVAVMDEIRADMASQLRRVNEMQQSGELPALNIGDARPEKGKPGTSPGF